VCRAVSHGTVPLCNVAGGLEVRYPGQLELGGGTSVVGLLSNWHSTLHTLCFEIWRKVADWAGQIFCCYGTGCFVNVSTKAHNLTMS
jgi:hypothetical protein